MSFSLPELPYSKDAFGKVLSAQTFQYHHGKHHKTYVDTLNTLIKGTQWENKSLENILMKYVTIIQRCVHGKIFNNAAQHWNHSFYWHCMTPEQIEPEGQLKQAIVSKWGSVDKFLEDFSKQAEENFGSGWTWLAKQGKDIAIVNTSNAGNPLTSQFQPLLTVDIWQHAYYIDHRNSRANYLKNFKNIINWKFVEMNYKAEKVELKL